MYVGKHIDGLSQKEPMIRMIVYASSKSVFRILVMLCANLEI